MAERRRPSRDEAELWKAVTKDVKRIERKSPLPVSEPAAPPGQKQKKTKVLSKSSQPGAMSRPGAMAPQRPAQPDLRHGRAAGVDKRTVERLRRGQIVIDAEIDLHGHTQEEAHRALGAFISRQVGASRRCVRIVTGKGAFREGGGVLKTAVPRWLNESPLRDQVLAFSHARRDDGGEGALYVLLRRKRPDAGPPE
jgi:DNA-nicking Smr family endonuclease